MRIFALASLAALVAGAEMAHPQHAPYAGQQERAIKSLSRQDIAGYESGAGMGLAKAAELNGYPGPMHSLEHADMLGLDATQRRRIETLMRGHKDEARRLGAEVVRLEGELDALFAMRKATAAAVEAKLAQIASAQAKLRGSHLKAHLATTALLSPDQVRLYNHARGY
jgi:Spy/CpxP family protein refolding chaperone